jgi:hypothetical protein
MATGWKRLAHKKLSSAAVTIDSGTFAVADLLRIVVYTSGTNTETQIRFNSDTGNNYSSNRENDGGNEADFTSQSMSKNNATGDGLGTVMTATIYNRADKEKQAFCQQVASDADGASNAPRRAQGALKWANTSDRITSIQVVNNYGSGNTFAAGSYITVFAATDDSVTDEKTTITNVPVGTRFEETDTRKIYRMSNGGTMSSLDEDFSSYSDQAAANASWVPTNDQAALRVDTSANVLKYEINSSYGSYPNVTNCNTLKDLGENAITGDFTLKFKFRILSNGNQINYNCSCVFGIFETTAVNDNGTNDSGIGIQPTFQSGDESIRFNVQYGYSNYNRTGNMFDSVLPADVDDYWVKIVRSGSTTTCYIYSDAYSTLMRPALSVHDDKANALRYIGFKNYMRFNAGGGNYATFEVDDIELDLTPSWVEKGRK